MKTRRSLVRRVVTVGLAATLMAAGGALSAASLVSADGAIIKVGPIGCGDPAYITDGEADNVQIQAALLDANSGDTVFVCAGRYEYANDVQWADSNTSIRLLGAGVGKTTLDGNYNWNILVVQASNVQLEVEKMTLTNGYAGWGSAILLFDFGQPSTAIVREAAIVDNDNAISVGAVAVEDGTVEAYNSLFSGNHAPSYGGAIYATDGVYVELSRFVGNSADEHGGAVFNANDFAKIELVNSDFIRNHAGDTIPGYGGAVYGYAVDSRDSRYLRNSADFGGAIATYAGYLGGEPNSYAMEDNIFRSNFAGLGRALYIWVYDETSLSGIRSNRFIGTSAAPQIYLQDDDGGAFVTADGRIERVRRAMASWNMMSWRKIAIGY